MAALSWSAKADDPEITGRRFFATHRRGDAFIPAFAENDPRNRSKN
jgi:hypothetical protein